MLMKGIAAAVIILVLVLFTIPRYNHLRQLKNAVEEGYANIDVQLARRQKLILSIIRLVDIYMKYEIGAFSSIVEMRNRWKEDNARYNIGGIALVALAEQYPNLRANETFIRLFSELSDTEDKLAFSRQHLNEAIRTFNNERCTFPNLILLGWFFKKEAYYDFPTEAERSVVWPDPIAGYNHRS
ncbi:MAG: LemA family protein [Dehalococcoidales bacterium]|nr:LemA family protein [Dehalococcoidales bacterium]